VWTVPIETQLTVAGLPALACSNLNVWTVAIATKLTHCGCWPALACSNLGAIFSNDPELLDLFEDVRGPLACMMVSFALAVFLERIPMAMGRTKVIM
jgi:hypothetical protein